MKYPGWIFGIQISKLQPSGFVMYHYFGFLVHRWTQLTTRLFQPEFSYSSQMYHSVTMIAFRESLCILWDSRFARALGLQRPSTNLWVRPNMRGLHICGKNKIHFLIWMNIHSTLALPPAVAVTWFEVVQTSELSGYLQGGECVILQGQKCLVCNSPHRSGTVA